MSNKKIILTGGAGFIGSCYLWKLNSNGLSDVIVVDDPLDKEKEKNLSGKNFLDHIDKDVFMEMVKKGKAPAPGHVVHMGACSSTTCADRPYLMKNNFEYTVALAEWARKNKSPFLYASSAATYGDGSFGYSDSDENTRRLKPLNLYGESKQLFDLWALDNDMDKEITGLKFFNVFGPNEYHKGEMMSVICKKFKHIREKGEMELFRSYKKGISDGEQKRDFIYIKDAVEVMDFFFKNPSRTGIFNLGTGVARSWNDLARAIFSSLEKEPKLKYVEMPETIRDKYQYFTEADMAKTKKSGCAVKFMPLEASVRDYVVNFLDKGKYL